jgi:ribosomal protein S18 acetylase RimI-like enzyme
MALRPEHLGRRVVVRRMVRGERGPSGGPAMTDVLGVLGAFTESTLLVRRDDGELVTVDRADVVAAKPVPPRTLECDRISPDDLQLVCAAGWQAPVQARLGTWVLRAGGGFTGRANSALPVGEPGVPLDDALERVKDFYARAGLPTQAQVVVGSEVMDALLARSWTRSRPNEADTLVQVARVAAARRASKGATGSDEVGLRPSPNDDWLRRYGRSTGASPDLVRSLLLGAERVTFAQVGEPAVAVGRAVVTGDWVGLYAVEVEPERRGSGLGSTIVDALLAWGAANGARSAYLQVLADNGAGLALYAPYGFRTHHSYRYLSPPTQPERSSSQVARTA